MAKTLISEMYCTKCGNRCMSIPRKKGGERESGHLKKVYCIFCKTEWNAAECDQNGHYTYRDFKLEFENGNFDEEGQRKETLAQLKARIGGYIYV